MMISRCLTAVALVVVMLAASPVQAKTIKIATMAPEDSPWFEVLSEMAQGWKQASGGEVDIKIYPSGIAGDEFDVIRKMRVGQIDAAMLSIGSLPDISKQLRALHMPLMIENNDELDHVMNAMSPTFESALSRQGFRVLAWGDAGFVHFFSTRPVISPDDLKPMRLGVWGSNSKYIDAWKDMGYNPVPIAANEIIVELKTGLVETIVVPPIASLSFQWFGIARHMTELPWAPMVGAIVISERAWKKKVPKGLRAKFLEIAAAASSDSKDKTRAVAPKAIAAMQANGLTVHPVPPEVLEEWRARVMQGFSPLVGDVVPADLLAQVQKLVAEYRDDRAN
jgi:TRAP-type C4-dicarboxylate transport system substrate-binding protein